MGVRAGVGSRAVVPQGGVALAAVGRRERDGASKLAMRTGRRAEGASASARNKPTTYWLHRRGQT